jgi:hypothetical protein
MTEHVPSPVPWEEWTAEDHMRFRMAANFCPMCLYKYNYGVLQQLISTAQESEDESIIAAMTPIVAQKQSELMELGLFIATSVDEANKQAGAAHLN